MVDNMESLDNFFKSTALIVDDEIVQNNKSKANKIKSAFEELGTCFLIYQDIPDEIFWDSFNNISFAILDWDLKKESDEIEGVVMGATLKEEKIQSLIMFIKHLLKRYVIPVFIFSQQNTEMIIQALNNDEETKWAIDQKQLLIKSKNALTTKTVKRHLAKWYSSNPSVSLIKAVDKSITAAKSDLFYNMYKIGCKWPLALYQTILKDNPADIDEEINDFIISALIGRIENQPLEKDLFSKKYKCKCDEISKIYSLSKLFTYGIDKPNVAHTGDLYIHIDDSTGKKKYLINITANCNIRYNEFLVLQGEVPESYEYNKTIGIVEKVNTCSIPFLDGNKYITFNLRKYKIIKCKSGGYNKMTPPCKDEYQRIGRLMYPYINILQNKFSQYVCRQGITRHPLEYLKP